MKLYSYKFVFIFFLLVFLAGCASQTFPKPDIKDDFCGVHINYQYCKCAFHNEFCETLGVSKSDANTYVYAEYNTWVDELFETWKSACIAGGGVLEDDTCVQKYGVIEKDGVLYINSKPGEVLHLTVDDLPPWALAQMVTVGASITNVGPPDTVATGDNNVLLNGKPVARLDDMTAHGGTIVDGSSNIFINGVPAAYVTGMTVCPMVAPGPVPHIGGPIVTTGWQETN